MANKDFFDVLDDVKKDDQILVKEPDDQTNYMTLQGNIGSIKYFKDANDYLLSQPEYINSPELVGPLFVISVESKEPEGTTNLLAYYNNDKGYFYNLKNLDSMYFTYKDLRTNEIVRSKKPNFNKLGYGVIDIDTLAKYMHFDSSVDAEKFFNKYGVDFKVDEEKYPAEYQSYDLLADFETTPDNQKKDFILNLNPEETRSGDLFGLLKLLKEKYPEVLFSINQTDLKRVYFDWMRKEPRIVMILSLRDLTEIMRPEDLVSFSKIVRNNEKFVKLLPDLKKWAERMSSMLEDEDFPEVIIKNFDVPQTKAPTTHYLSASEMVQRIKTNPSDLELLKNKENYDILINSKSENAYSIILSLLEEIPQMIKYLKPLDQKVEFQEIALNADISLLKDIYLPDFDLIMRLADNHNSKEFIEAVLNPKQWENENTRKILGDRRELHYGIKSPNLKGTTPKLWTSEEVEQFKTKILNNDPWKVEYFPAEMITNVDQDDIVKTLANNKATKTDYVKMVSVLRSKGIVPGKSLVSMVMNSK